MTSGNWLSENYPQVLASTCLTRAPAIFTPQNSQGINSGSGLDVPDQTLCQAPFSVALHREWPGCHGIWVGRSRDQKNFMQDNFGLIFRSLVRVISLRFESLAFVGGHICSQDTDWPSETLRSLCCDSNRTMGAHSHNIRSMWNCGIACLELTAFAER